MFVHVGINHFAIDVANYSNLTIIIILSIHTSKFKLAVDYTDHAKL